MTSPLVVGTDGSAVPNPGPCGCAWVAEDGRWGAEHLGQGTNNIGELTAILRAIQANPNQPLHVLADSQYAINSVTTWGPAWRRKGVTGKKNMELIFEIIDLVEARRATVPVTFEWVRAHDRSNSTPLNSLADEYANAASKRDFGAQTGVIENIAERSAAAAARQPSSSGTSRTSGGDGSGDNGAAKRSTGKWATMTELGKPLGLSAVQVGKILTNAGLRDGSLATDAAVADGLARHRKMKSGTEFSVWDRKRVTEILRQQ
ncbi:ribonuclease HI [Gulosibacter chungangensis]|nr:RNase H family protein [Gulosibacter chungangensis]